MITLIAAFITGVFSVLVAWIAHAYKHQGPTDPLVIRCQKIQEFHEEYMLKSHPLFIRNSRAKALVGSLRPNFYEVAYLFHKPIFENLAIELAKFRWFFIFEFESNGFIKKIKLDKTKVWVISFLCTISYIVLVGFALYGLDGQNGTIAEVQLLYSNSKYVSIFNIVAPKIIALIGGILALLYGIKLISLLATGKEIEN